MASKKIYAAGDVLLQSLVLALVLSGLFEPVHFLLGLLPLGLLQLASALAGWWVHADRLRGYYFGSALAYVLLGVGLFVVFDELPFPEPVGLKVVLGLYLGLSLAAGLAYYLYSWRTIRTCC